MDPEIEELKELIRRNIALSEETNKRVAGMQRAARLSRFLGFLWWGAILVISAYTYYYYVMPQVERILELYGSAQGFEDQFAEFFSQFRSGSSQ